MSNARDPASEVEAWDIERLIPYARNSRLHSDRQIDQIAASMREFGWTMPVLIDEEGTIIAGHGRVLAAKKLGRTEAPVVVARGWDEARRRAYVIADNKLALNATWDEEMLSVEVVALKDDGFDVGLLGFSDAELSKALAEVGDLQYAGDAEEEWEGMPEYDNPPKYCQKITISFAEPKDVQEFARLIGQEITPKTRYAWFPYRAPDQLKDLRWVVDEEDEGEEVDDAEGEEGEPDQP